MSKKSKSEVEMMGTGAALLSTFWSLFTKEVSELGGTAEDLRRLTKPEGAPLIADFAKRLVNAKKEVREFKTWKTIKLGTYKSIGLLRKALEAGKFRIGDYAAQILPKTILCDTETELELVRITVGELGFAGGATRREIYERAIELGLALCPAEVGPQLRLQYADQPMNEWLVIAMESATDSDGGLLVFSVSRHVDGSWLGTGYGHAVCRWHAGSVWVFARRK